jgi:hypothetical protein
MATKEATKVTTMPTQAEVARADITVVIPRILPPEAFEAANRISDKYRDTESLVIYDNDDEQVWSEALKSLKGDSAALEGIRMGITRSLDQSKQMWMALFRNPQTQAQVAERRIKDAIVDRHRRIERENQERAAKAQAAAREQAEKDAATKAQKLIDSGHPVEARRVVEQAKSAELPPAIPDQRPQTQATGLSIKRPMKFQLIEGQEDLVPREFCSPDEKKIRAFVTAYGEKADIPGVRVWKDYDIASTKTAPVE